MTTNSIFGALIERETFDCIDVTCSQVGALLLSSFFSGDGVEKISEGILMIDIV